ncbi:MAG: ornithine carbamoyltransferase [Oscillospiraceae bacterium]|nr:ornithine carbamoyltransferase [Oscillospiraceae bacterium]
MKHLLKMLDLSKTEITEILDLADRLKYEKKHAIPHNLLKGKTLGMIFEKSSTRTRVSFEAGIYQLGGQGLFLSSQELQMGRGEPIQDTARVLSRYLDGIMIRTFKQDDVEKLAEFGEIPVINGLTDFSHPCQVLADLMTVREYKNKLEGLKLCYVGDGNNMANSLTVGCLKVGMSISLACPDGYHPPQSVLDFAKDYNNFELVSDPVNAAQDADVVYTDVWASMGMESEVAQRRAAFKGYQVSHDLLKHCKSDVIVLHCLPAKREEEITAAVMEEHANEIFDEAENRLHAQKAVMVKLMGDDS